jgi:hypothetical protein
MRYLFFIFLYLQTATSAQSYNEDLTKAIGEVIYNDFDLVDIDSSLQVVYKDTIDIVKSKLKGSWRYQGIKKYRQQDLLDTLSRTCYLKNGEVYWLENGEYRKSEDFVESYFNFDDDYSSWVNKLVYKTPNYYTSLHRPFIYAVYHQREVGILIKGFIGTSFLSIKFLDEKVLILKESKDSYWCYLRQ